MSVLSKPESVRNRHYYLIIRPFSIEPRKIEPYLGPLSTMTGLDRLTLRQKFTGRSLQVLRQDADPGPLEEISEKLQEEGFPSVIVGKDEIENPPRPVRISGFEIGRDQLGLIDPEGERVCSLDGSRNGLLVLSSTHMKELRNKLVAKLVMTKNGSFPLGQLLTFIFQNHPVMDFYISGRDTPVRLDGLKFNYNTLEDENKGAVALNFPVLIKLIRKFSSDLVLDTGFGENSLPFLHPLSENSPERVLREFSLYSRFVSLVYAKGVFAAERPRGALPDVPLLKDLGGLVWAGPLLFGGTETETKRAGAVRQDAQAEESPRVLPSPPAGPVDVVPGRISTWGTGFHLYLGNYKRYVRALGPPELVYPVSFVFLGSFMMGHLLKRPLFLSLGLIAFGVILFIHAFVALNRKRDIENCPTTRIRSMPMGLVEVKGRARQKYFLKAPYSYTDCVYYAYKVYEWVGRGDGSTCRLKKWGESGKVPFYVEDETGRVLVDPEHAIIKAGISQDVSRSFFDMLGSVPASEVDGQRKVVEVVIPAGQPIYVMGFARPVRTGSGERKKTYLQRLRELKRDRAGLAQYDHDGDGKISEEEWDAARNAIEEEILLGTAGGGEDRVAIGEHPAGGLFYISDKHEEVLTRFMAWRIPLFLVLGAGAMIGGLVLL